MERAKHVPCTFQDISKVRYIDMSKLSTRYPNTTILTPPHPAHSGVRTGTYSLLFQLMESQSEMPGTSLPRSQAVGWRAGWTAVAQNAVNR